MRILSQNRMIDLPYENVGVSINHNDSTKIVAYPAGNYNKEFGSWKMAEYSTEAKARKAMKMLRDRYTGKDETVFEISHIKRSSTDNFYFQFPADDEVEV